MVGETNWKQDDVYGEHTVMTERLREYALVAEIISALAIVVSLVFVGLQVRQSAEETAINSNAVQASVRESILQSDMNLLLYAGEHDLMEGPITPEKRQKQLALTVAQIRARENAWVQHQNGIVDDATYLSYRDAFIKNLSNEEMRSTWKELTSYYDLVPGFADDINAEIAARYGHD